MSSFQPFRLQNVLRDFIRTEHWREPFAATLTLRQARYVISEAGLQVRVPLTEERASQNFRHFLNLLSCRVYGASWKRYGKKVRAFPVIEGGTTRRMHFHALIECPRDDLASSYPSLIEQCWQRTDWGYTQVRVSSGADNGWVRYMTKLRSKPDFGSSIDWMNFRN